MEAAEQDIVDPLDRGAEDGDEQLEERDCVAAGGDVDELLSFINKDFIFAPVIHSVSNIFDKNFTVTAWF